MSKNNIDKFEWVGDPKKLLLEIINNIPYHIFWKNTELVYQGANRKFSNVAGLSKDDQVIGKNDYDMAWKKEEADFFRMVDQKVMGTNQPELKIIEPQKQADGTEAWLETSKIPITDEFNRVIGILGMFRDVTPVKQAEKDNQKLIHELRSKNMHLQETMDTLMRTQGQLIISEKMATLGQLISRVAHEVNTPMGVIKAHAESMADQFQDALVDMPLVYRSLTDVQLGIFDLLVSQGAKLDGYLSPREERALKKQLLAKLSELEVLNGEALVYYLIDLNVSLENISDYMPILELENCERVLKVASYLSVQQKSFVSTRDAVDNASRLIHALKSYSQKGNPNAQKEVFDLVESIDVVLILFSNHIKHGIEIVKKFDLDKQYLIDGFKEEIGQIWLNLIQNSIDATGDKGVVEISIEDDDEYFVICVKDYGCGIRIEDQAKIFKPFYTTKSKSQGTGLGLDIVSNVVNRHDGIISLESTLGEGTEFYIRLKKYLQDG